MELYSKKTVLITGATGLIGSHIVDELMSMGDVKVIALSRNRKKLEEGFQDYLINPNFQIKVQDITDPLQFDGPIHYIFHAAGPMESDIIKNFPIDIINPNISGTINCLEFLKKQKDEKKINGRMILFSSVTVYGNNTDQDISVSELDTEVTEILEAVSAPYSQSKRMSEVITLSYIRQFGIDAVISRFSTVYGNTRFIPKTAFFEFIKKGVAGKDITMNSTGLPRRDNVYIDDAVRGVLVVGSSGLTGESYNISSNGELGNYASVDEIAQIIAEISNTQHRRQSMKVLFRTMDDGVRRPGIRLINTKLKKLGWGITVSLCEGIQKTMEDFLDI